MNFFFFQHIVSSTCIVCGEINKFVIRECLKKDVTITNPMTWNTKEKFQSSATVFIQLIKEELNFRPIDILPELKEKKSLIFEFPESNNDDDNPGHLSGHTDSSGIRPVLSMPDLLMSPQMLFSAEIPTEHVSQMIVQKLEKISEIIFQSPESCSCSGDVAGSLSALSNYFLPLSFDQLKDVKREMKNSNGTKEIVESLFYDVLSTVGTNPSTMLIKEDIENGDLTGHAAAAVLQGAFRSIKTPTKDLLKALVHLIKNLKYLQSDENTSEGSSGHNLFRIGMLQMSKLLHRACVHPVSRMLEFPINIYGHFCSKDSSVITEEWIPFLESELKRPSMKTNQTNEHDKLVVISALGKLGHLKGLHFLAKVVEGKLNKSPMIRSVAVYSLIDITKLNPELVKPILLSIIGNPAENVEVRIAALFVMPYSQPSMAELQKIAIRSWFEPSKQVSSFVYSTLKNLAFTQVPELKDAGLKASAIIHLVKPDTYGILFSHNAQFDQFVNYLRTSVSKTIAWAYNGKDKIPSAITVSNNFHNSAFEFRGLSYNIYSQGMDYLLDKLLDMNNDSDDHKSKSVKEQLEKISKELKIESPKCHHSDIFIQSSFAGFENILAINKEYFLDILGRTTDALFANPKLLSKGFKFGMARAFQVFNIHQVEPTSSGFLRFTEKSMPVVYSAKGFFKGENPLDSPMPIPTKMSATLLPNLNGKMKSHIGVLCPFTQTFIGAGVDISLHLSTPIEVLVDVEDEDHASVTLKTPQSITKVKNTLGSFH